MAVFKVAKIAETTTVTERITEYVLLEADSEQQAVAFAEKHADVLSWGGEEIDDRRNYDEYGDESTRFASQETFDTPYGPDVTEEVDELGLDAVLPATEDTVAVLVAACDERTKKHREETEEREKRKAEIASHLQQLINDARGVVAAGTDPNVVYRQVSEALSTKFGASATAQLGSKKDFAKHFQATA